MENFLVHGMKQVLYLFLKKNKKKKKKKKKKNKTKKKKKKKKKKKGDDLSDLSDCDNYQGISRFNNEYKTHF